MKPADNPLFAGREKVVARAVFLGGRIDVRAAQREGAISRTPLTVHAGAKGIAVVFRYGAVVLFDVSEKEETGLLHDLFRMVRTSSGPKTGEEEAKGVENVDIVREEGSAERVQGNAIVVPAFTLLHLHVVADILGKSAALDFYEKRVAGDFESIEPLAVRLKEKGHRGVGTRDLLRHIGGVLINLHHMVGRVEVVEKPDFLWEEPHLERFYARLEDEFEIKERHLALERKLELISRTAQTVLDIIQTKRTLRVEWYIVILIVVEIVLTLYELFLYPHT